MKAPLYNHLIKYNKEITSFHMPGHKFGKGLEMEKLSLLDLDVTEVPGLDNLYDPQGIILKAQKEMALKYKSKETIFLTNGSTAGIIASMMSICNPGDSLIIARNNHHSVWNGLILGGIQPIYISPSYEKNYHILGGISPIKLEEALRTYPEAKGVLIVSPTYEGLVSDIEGIARIVHKYKKVLIVDEAHGAHFVWDKEFPKSAIECGADIVIQSMHKTLPALTQSGLLHLNSDIIDKETILSRLQMIQTSSPSYIIMGLMDYMRAYMQENSKLWGTYLKDLLKAREALLRLENLLLLSKNICNKADIWDLDISKIVIYTSNSNITGIELGQILRSGYNLQVELEAKEYIIAMSTIGDTSYNLEKLYKALLEIDAKLTKGIPPKTRFNIMQLNYQQGILPRDVFFGEKEYIFIEKCNGRISAANIMLYPPGIPIICIGEVFSKDIIDGIKDCTEKLLGVIYKNGNILVSVAKEKGNER